MQLWKATRKKVWAKVMLSWPSGTGKTVSSLKFASWLTKDWSKVALIDTEWWAANNYADRLDLGIWSFNVLELNDHSPESYIKAIDICLDADMDVIIIDSLTHLWKRILERKDKMSGNDFAKWKDLTPLYDSVINKILSTPKHIIATGRWKTEYILEENGWKMVPKKVWMWTQVREWTEFEFDIIFDLSEPGKNIASVSKDRTWLYKWFLDTITDKTADKYRERSEWNESVLDMNIIEKLTAKFTDKEDMIAALSKSTILTDKQKQVHLDYINQNV